MACWIRFPVSPRKCTEALLSEGICRMSRNPKLELEYQDVLTDLPGTTDFLEHRVNLVSDEPVRSRPYSIPFSVRQSIAREGQTKPMTPLDFSDGFL